MNSATKDRKSLLPQGFYDLTSPNAFKMIEVNYNLVKFLQDLGYNLVRPTLMEFEEFLDKDFSSELFKVTDPVSGKMLAIRNDITPQIVRIVKEKYLNDSAPGSEIKISYTGQIIRKNASESVLDRQLTQTGYEYIGEDSAQNDAAVISTAVEGLNKLGLKNFTIDLSYPALLDQLINKAKLSKKGSIELVNLIEQKETAKIQDNLGEGLEDIVRIITECEKISKLEQVEEIILALIHNLKDEKIIAALTRVIEVSKILKDLRLSNKITISLFEKGSFKYHTGLCYSFISRKSFEEIGRGGRYIIKKDEKKFSAVGFTFIIDSLLNSLER